MICADSCIFPLQKGANDHRKTMYNYQEGEDELKLVPAFVYCSMIGTFLRIIGCKCMYSFIFQLVLGLGLIWFLCLEVFWFCCLFGWFLSIWYPLTYPIYTCRWLHNNFIFSECLKCITLEIQSFLSVLKAWDCVTCCSLCSQIHYVLVGMGGMYNLNSQCNLLGEELYYKFVPRCVYLSVSIYTFFFRRIEKSNFIYFTQPQCSENAPSPFSSWK